jgi:hypothetical protein
MNLSYRTRRMLARLGKAVVALIIAACLLWLCWIIWVGRYIVYTPNGAKLDFSLGAIPEGVPAVPPTDNMDVNIYYDEPVIELPPSVVEKTSIHGYYIDFEDLKTDIPAVKAKLEALPAGTAVMLDVKSIKGFFHYSTSVGKTNSKDVDIAQMNELIQYLSDSNLYAIARIPAFRDWEYGLNHVPSGLPKKGGNGSLWMDDSNCYWLDPTDEKALDYLLRITVELRRLGFDEVVYTDFRFPNTDKIIFEGDKAQAIADAAATLADACTTERFCVSFMSSSPAFPLPEGNCRVYLQDIAAADAETTAQQVPTDDPKLHVLFMTTVNDTRFNDYCVLRPLDSAH